MVKLYALSFVGVLTVTIFISIYYLLKKLYQLNCDFKRSNEIDKNINYACPKCGKTMENGFISAGKGISYRSNEAKQLGQMLNLKALLKNTMNLSFSNRENLAWRCKECNYILIDHSFLFEK